MGIGLPLEVRINFEKLINGKSDHLLSVNTPPRMVPRSAAKEGGLNFLTPTLL